MKNAILLIVLTFLLVISARPGVAETIEIPLDVQADFEPWADHFVAFDAGIPLPDISTVRLHLLGTGGRQEYIGCSSPYPWTYVTTRGHLNIALREADQVTYVSGTALSFEDGPRVPFDSWLEFDFRDFSGLEEGTGSVGFVNPARMFLNGIHWICPVGECCLISNATLVIEYGNPVPTEGTTWSTLKAIYR